MESPYYEPVKKTLEQEFKKLGECYFEITAKKKPSNKIKEFLDDLALYVINIEGFFPDIIGYVVKSNIFGGEERHIIAVEVKPKMKIKDIYQAKQYGEIFNAKHTLLICIEPLSEEIKRFLEKRPEILSHSAGYQTVKIGQLDKESKSINWYEGSPF